MNNKILFYLVLLLVFSCEEKETKSTEVINTEKKELTALPFKTIELKDMSAFKPVGNNWQIVGDAIADRVKKNTFSSVEGTGILLNTTKEGEKENLITNFKHGDIELEMDIMMPLASKSGIYLQSRYEVKLVDSWGTQGQKHTNIGSIPQEGNKGYASKVNAAKAPGLWQNLKIIFHAPKFDASGSKIKNAWIEKVMLNNLLLHQNIELAQPSNSSNLEEVAMAPLMIQGDKGAIAIKNISYKLYEEKAIGVENTTLKIYDNSKRKVIVKSLNDFKIIEEYKTDSISPLMRIHKRDQKVLSYTGSLNIPATGDYLFDATVNGGTYLIINNDTILNMNEDLDLNTTRYSKVNLKKGVVSFHLVYNKAIVGKQGYDFFVEGPKMQRYSLLKTGTTHLLKKRRFKHITLDATNKPRLQRSFLNHNGVKRSHCISVGLPGKLNYSLDLETGTLLHVWSGNFLNVTQMWHSRGEHQRGVPMGFMVSSHGDLDFAIMDNKNSEWPKKTNENLHIKQLGYELNTSGNPTFSFKINESKISNTFNVSTKNKRSFERTITLDTKKTIWHKIAKGEHIKAIANNTYIINNESYYITLPEGSSLKPIIRNINGNDELLVEIPKGNSTFNYSITW